MKTKLKRLKEVLQKHFFKRLGLIFGLNSGFRSNGSSPGDVKKSFTTKGRFWTAELEHKHSLFVKSCGGLRYQPLSVHVCTRAVQYVDQKCCFAILAYAIITRSHNISQNYYILRFDKGWVLLNDKILFIITYYNTSGKKLRYY